MRRPLLTTSVILVALCGCQEVIDIDLNSTAPKLVIEGNIHTGPGPYYVGLSKTVNFDDPNQFPTISNALVVISDDMGNHDTLEELTVLPGVYHTHFLQGAESHTYYLTVTAEGHTYTSQCTVPPTVTLDSLRSINLSTPSGINTLMLPVYTDAPGVKNFYRFIETINGDKQNRIFVFDDTGYDGLTNQRPLLSLNNHIHAGDTVIVEMQGISQDIYNYFFVLAQQNGGLINPSGNPANPPSNIQGENVIGYFSAYNFQSDTLIIP